MSAAATEPSRTRRLVAIFLVSLAGLLLEVAYTRIVSYKLWYYYTYLVIGLALLGIGSGGVFVAVSRRLRETSVQTILTACSLVGAASIAGGYLFIAWLPIDTIAIWDYGTRASVKNVALLGLLCFVLFATFIAIGIIVSTLLGRGGDDVPRLYFADLIGAGMACLIAVWLIGRHGPPSVVLISAAVLAAVPIVTRLPSWSAVVFVAFAGVLALLVPVANSELLPDVHPEKRKHEGGPGTVFSEWGPVFRVDVVKLEPNPSSALLVHDGSFGSGIYEWDGDVSSLSRYEKDPRSLPFDVLAQPPERELIIGSAGGQEILVSLYYEAEQVDAVELNPVTVSLLTDEFADYTGNIPEHPAVDLHTGDGRSFLARSDADYDLIWFVAPDSYAANNAASSGAFVLSESYLYTQEMIEESLEHLTDDGIVVAQFGELDVVNKPNRTARYIVTARAALEAMGVDNPADHLAVTGFDTDSSGDYSTIVVKRTPFTAAERDRILAGVARTPQVDAYHPAGPGQDDVYVARLASADSDEAAAVEAEYPREIGAITDDTPFFWHFASFGTVISNYFDPVTVSDPEDVIGERVLLLLLGFSLLYALVFLLLPFVAVRSQWRALPAKGISAVYFAALGLGFMFYEITMIQRLVLFLGNPTYSLTVTLAAILVSTGIGALASRRVAPRARVAMPVLLAVLAALTIFYRFALGGLIDNALSLELPARVLIACALLFPLGFCLGMFMPLGLGTVGAVPGHPEEYVAWSWAVNGFFSVVGAVLTTILSMQFGFRTVQFLAFGVYVVAALAFTRLRTTIVGRPVEGRPAA